VSWIADLILPCLADRLLDRQACRRLRRGACAGLRGEILGIGFGSGLNVPAYPPQVRRVLVVEPSRAALALAGRRIARRGIAARWAGPDAADLRLPDASVDGALSTWTLCTLPDPRRALLEIRRVLRPGAAYHFLEHGLSPEPRLARLQRRLAPVTRALGGGCRLDRDIAALIREAGFDLARLERFHMPGPRFATFMFLGTVTA
jgi:ubiquinone/menaquinone biosynthesis C-methylase UbiE